MCKLPDINRIRLVLSAILLMMAWQNIIHFLFPNWKREVSNKDVLKQAVSLVKHIGISRTRGLGLVRLALEEENIDQCETKCSRIMFTKDKLGEKNKIK